MHNFVHSENIRESFGWLLPFFCGSSRGTSHRGLEPQLIAFASVDALAGGNWDAGDNYVVTNTNSGTDIIPVGGIGTWDIRSETTSRAEIW